MKASLGSMRTHARILACEKSPDGTGGFSESWHDIGEIWMKIEPVRSSVLSNGKNLRGRRLSALHPDSMIYLATSQLNTFVQAGRRLVTEHGTLVVLDQPTRPVFLGRQQFYLAEMQPLDGRPECL